jgi:hypothetical protein
MKGFLRLRYNYYYFRCRMFLKTLLNGDGRTLPEHFEPRVLEAFRESEKVFEEIFETSLAQPEEDDRA